MTESAVSLQQLRTFGVNSALLDVDLAKHRCMAIIGDEVSGVRSLGDILLGFRRPFEGMVNVMGTNPTTLPRRRLFEFRRRIGYLPADDGLLQNLNLRENIALPLRFGSAFKEREISGRIAIILTALGLSEQASQLRPVAATEEQRRRAAVARALAFDPELVILEQPFDGLTLRTATELLETVRGGEHPDGSRRTVLILGQDLPHGLNTRIEDRVRAIRGQIKWESA